jgi:uncharacterized repeat protein (TIGR01451 family)
MKHRSRSALSLSCSIAVRLTLISGFLVSMVGVLPGMASQPVLASPDATITINVTTITDSLDAAGGDCAAMTPDNITTTGDGLVSLREAICAANNNTNDITIMLEKQIYAITRTGVEDDNLTGDFDIHADGGDVTITGGGIQYTVVQGLGAVGGTDRVFDVDPAATGGMTVTFSGLTISRGYAVGYGGGISNHASTVNLINCSVYNNQAHVVNSGGGGGIFNTDGGTLNLTGSSIIKNLAFAGSAGCQVAGGGILNFSGLSIADGFFQENRVTTIAGPGAVADGGGVYQGSGILSVNDSYFIDNEAWRGGGLHVRNSDPVEIISATLEGNQAAYWGGGIYLTNNLMTVTLSTFEDNDANLDGGGIAIGEAGLFLSESTLSNSNAQVNGGGIYIAMSTVTIEDSDLIENEALGDGGGIYNLEGKLTIRDKSELRDNTATTGGAIYNDSKQLTTIEDSYFNYNDANGDAGGIWNEGSEMVISGTSFYENEATDSCGAIGNESGSEMTISDCTIRSNESADNGGGVCTVNSELTISDTMVTENTTTGDGAGIYGYDGILKIYNSNISDNVNSDGDGGGIFWAEGSATITDVTLSNNHADYRGGGIYNILGYVNIYRSAVLNNTSKDLDSQNRGGVPSDGGGIYNTEGSVYVVNSTIYGNEATFNGGGVYSELGTVYLQNVTVSENFADNNADTYGDGGGVFCNPDGVIQIKNSILYFNTDKSGGGHDCSGTVTIYGNNLIEDPNGCVLAGLGQNTPDVNPLLGPLGSHGGKTHNQSLLFGSPAIDSVTDCTNFWASTITEDQRGVKRPWGTACDIGAYEAEPNLLLNKIVSPHTEVDYHGTVTYTLTISNAGVAVAMNVRLTDTLPSEVDFGDWITQPTNTEVNSDVVTWSGTIAGRTQIDIVFTAVHVGDYGEEVVNWVYMGHAGEIEQEPAYFEVEPTPWRKIYLPLVERGGE